MPSVRVGGRCRRVEDDEHDDKMGEIEHCLCGARFHNQTIVATLEASRPPGVPSSHLSGNSSCFTAARFLVAYAAKSSPHDRPLVSIECSLPVVTRGHSGAAAMRLSGDPVPRRSSASNRLGAPGREGSFAAPGRRRVKAASTLPVRDDGANHSNDRPR